MFGWLRNLLYPLFVQVPLYLFESVVNVSRWIVGISRRAIVGTRALGEKAMNWMRLVLSGFDGNRYGDRWHNYTCECVTFVVLAVLLLFASFVGSEILWIAVFVVIATTLGYGFHRVQAPDRYIVELIGRPFAIWTPGPHIFIPILFTVRARMQFNQVKEYKLFLDSDETSYPDIATGKEVKWELGDIDFEDDTAAPKFAIFLKVISPYRALYDISDLMKTLVNRIEGAARATIAPLYLKHALAAKEEAGKLILSYFLREQSEWEKVRVLGYYDKTGERLPAKDSEGNFTERMAATQARPLVPFDAFHPDQVFDPDHPDNKGNYDIRDWGITFSNEGIVLRDIELSPETKQLRRKVLERERDVQIAEFERKIAELQGLGEQNRLKKLQDLGLSASEAAVYASALKMMDSKTLRDKTLLLAPGSDGLDFRRLAAIFGVTADQSIKATTTEGGK